PPPPPPIIWAREGEAASPSVAPAASPSLAQMMGGGGGGMGGGGSTGTSIINPPVGAAFADPLEIRNFSTVPGLVEVDLEAAPAWVNVNGTMANLLTYNGSYPAPTIRVKKGDTLRVHLKNSLPMMGTNMLGHQRDMTNLHTHGLHVSPSGNSDNMMIMLMSGDAFDYEYDLSKQDAGTLNFYHPHTHGTVAEQYWGGMAGALVVEDDINALSAYETHLMIIKDITLSGSAPEPYTSMMDYMHGKEGDTVMVNGQVNPLLNIRPGQVQRWRIVNACNARFLKLGLEGHTLQIIGTEGGLLDKPYPVSSILLSPGERLDVLVKANQTSKSYRLLSLPYSRMGNMGGQQVTLVTVSYKGSRMNDAVPPIINPAAVRINPMIAKTERIALSMGQGKGYINGITFTMENHYAIHSHLGTYEIWEVVNQSGMDHPFHQHVNGCQVLSITGGDAAYASFLTKTPAWKDTVLIPKWGNVRMLVPVMDYSGMAMFHCHIIEHEDIGMMGVWHIMDGEMPMPM
ncbi:MAG TPA: multicopper oxidase family protein, partial [Nitrospirota bacterium]|nr:multicopper oxidase family protein [Nitrospirota bacterium]